MWSFIIKCDIKYVFVSSLFVLPFYPTKYLLIIHFVYLFIMYVLCWKVTQKLAYK